MRFALIALALAGFLVTHARAASAADALRKRAAEQIGKLPAKMPAPKGETAIQAELGKMLYFEPRLSANQGISCNSCHNLAAGGTDNLPFSIGHEAKRGGRSAPTVLNAGFQLAQFWDGRAPSLEAQAVGPITNPVEMAMYSGKEVLAVLNSMPEYRTAFEKAFGAKSDAVSMPNVGRALAAFERTLVSRGRFDTWLAGNDKALSAQEKKGLEAFLDTGCAACHTGPNFGGQMYQKFGVVKPAPTNGDEGRFTVTKVESDRLLFKVPMLRDAARTAPYFHDGSVWSLEEAIKIMADVQLGIDLQADKVADIATFLRALPGTTPGVKPPTLPASTSSTPKPYVPKP